MEIRPATEADVPLVVRFIRGLAEYERLLHECQATEEKVRASLFGARPDAEVLIAEVDGEPAGFALFFHNYSTFRGLPGLYLEDLFVEPACRGKGHGKALFRAVAKLAVDRGCGRFEWAVLDWNAPSIAFYESFGATPMNEWTTYRLTGDPLRALGGRA